MNERNLRICLEHQLEVRPANFCRFNDFPEDRQEVQALKGFSNKADQGCQTDVIGEHLKVLVFAYLFWKKIVEFYKENSSTIVFVLVVLTYSGFLIIRANQEQTVYQKSFFVYGLQPERDLKGFQECGEDERFKVVELASHLNLDSRNYRIRDTLKSAAYETCLINKTRFDDFKRNTSVTSDSDQETSSEKEPESAFGRF